MTGADAGADVTRREVAGQAVGEGMQRSAPRPDLSAPGRRLTVTRPRSGGPPSCRRGRPPGSRSGGARRRARPRCRSRRTRPTPSPGSAARSGRAHAGRPVRRQQRGKHLLLRRLEPHAVVRLRGGPLQSHVASRRRLGLAARVGERADPDERDDDEHDGRRDRGDHRGEASRSRRCLRMRRSSWHMVLSDVFACRGPSGRGTCRIGQLELPHRDRLQEAHQRLDRQDRRPGLSDDVREDLERLRLVVQDAVHAG